MASVTLPLPRRRLRRRLPRRGHVVRQRLHAQHVEALSRQQPVDVALAAAHVEDSPAAGGARARSDARGHACDLVHLLRVHALP